MCLHRFTSAIRTGMTFNGSETITIGGGDEIWFYVNKILVLELHGDISGNPIKCKKINLANAGQEGNIGMRENNKNRMELLL